MFDGYIVPHQLLTGGTIHIANHDLGIAIVVQVVNDAKSVGNIILLKLVNDACEQRDRKTNLWQVLNSSSVGSRAGDRTHQ